jgi:hypothetical protein
MPDTFTSLLLSSISKENIMTIEKAMRIRNVQFELRHLEQLQPSPLHKQQQARREMTFIM